MKKATSVEEQVTLEKYVQLKYVLDRDNFEGFNRKIQMKAKSTKEVINESDGTSKQIVTKALFILKFGGELTHAGVS
jgi:hypothetical protein